MKKLGIYIFILALWQPSCSSAKTAANCSCDMLDNSKSDPVCGSDGQTYQTECHALCAGKTVAYKGGCAEFNTACEIDSQCFEVSPTCCQPICASEAGVGSTPPQICQCEAAPLHCGCDNKKCSAGTLQTGATCDPKRDRCSPGSICCTFCPDGGDGCSSQCVSGIFTQASCPRSPPSE